LAEQEHIEIDFPSLGSRPDPDPEPVARIADEQEDDDFSWLAMAFADEDDPDVTELASHPDDDADVEQASLEDIEAIASALDDGSTRDAVPTELPAADDSGAKLPPTAEAEAPPVPAPLTPEPSASIDEPFDDPIPDSSAPDFAADLSEVIADAPDVEVLSVFEADDIDPLESLEPLDEVLDLDDVVAQLTTGGPDDLALTDEADPPDIGESAPDAGPGVTGDSADQLREDSPGHESSGPHPSVDTFDSPDEDLDENPPAKAAPLLDEDARAVEPDEPVEPSATTDETTGAEESRAPRRSGLREELLGTFSQLYGKR